MRLPAPLSRGIVVGLAALVVSGLTGALLLADAREIWLDETQSVTIARFPLSEQWRFIIGDNHPPVYFLLLAQWVRLAGDHNLALRSFSVVAYAVAIPLTFAIARRHFRDDVAALAVAALLAFSPAVFYYATEVRMYALAMLWMVGALGALLAIWDGATDGWRSPALLAALCALAFYTHYVAVFTLAGVLLAWAVRRWSDRAQRGAMLRTATILLALTLPWLPTLLAQRGRKAGLDAALRTSWTDPAALSFGAAPVPVGQMDRIRSLAENAASILGVYPADETWLTLLLAVPLLALLAAALPLLFSVERPTVWLGAAASLATVVGTQALGLGSRRYFLMAAPFAVFALGAAVAALRAHAGRRVAGTVVAGLAVLLNVAGDVRVLRSEQPHPWRSVISVLQASVAADDVIVFDAIWGQVPFDYHAAGTGLVAPRRGFPVDVAAWWEEQPTKSWGSRVITHAATERFVADVEASHPRTVWVVAYEAEYYDPKLTLLTRFATMGRPAVRCITGGEVGGITLYRLGGPATPACP